jgi:hypothetical protein
MTLFRTPPGKLLAAASAALVLAAAALVAAEASFGAGGTGKATGQGLAQTILKAEKSQLAAAVKAGILTPAQEAAIEVDLTQLAKGFSGITVPAGGLGGLAGLGNIAGLGNLAGLAGLAGAPTNLGALGHGLQAAESYLGLSTPQIVSELLNGKSLAEVARAHGKSASGLVQVLLNAEKPQLAAAVKAGRLSQAAEATIESGLKQLLTTLVGDKVSLGGSLGSIASGLLAGLGA